MPATIMPGPIIGFRPPTADDANEDGNVFAYVGNWTFELTPWQQLRPHQAWRRDYTAMCAEQARRDAELFND
jgi:hypothetical protein